MYPDGDYLLCEPFNIGLDLVRRCPMTISLFMVGHQAEVPSGSGLNSHASRVFKVVSSSISDLFD